MARKMSSADAREALKEKEATTSDLASAKALLAGLPVIVLDKVSLAPIPMQNGRYGWLATTSVQVPNTNKSVTVTTTLTHPESEAGISGLNVAMAQLARERVAAMQVVNAPTSAEAALNKMSPEERAKFLTEYIQRNAR